MVGARCKSSVIFIEEYTLLWQLSQMKVRVFKCSPFNNHLARENNLLVLSDVFSSLKQTLHIYKTLGDQLQDQVFQR